MPLLVTPAKPAYASLRRNREAFWPGRSTAPNRLEPLATPGFEPSFKLVPGEKVFTIGSCFARNIEAQLRRLGYKIPMLEYVPEELTGKPLDGFNNKFTPQSMLNEVSWALDPEATFDPTDFFLPQESGLFIDGQLMSKIEVTEARAVERRREMNEMFRIAAQCRVIVITLGLVEAWFDKKTGVYLNRELPRHNAFAEPDRFESHVLSYEELLTATRQLVNLLLKHGHPEARIVMTVSPVPMTATFSGRDVLVANGYSKAVLRTVAEHVYREFEQVDYFPSYESVTLSNRDMVWQDDLIHVTSDIVALNVSRMAIAYAPSERHAEQARSIAPSSLAKAA